MSRQSGTDVGLWVPSPYLFSGETGAECVLVTRPEIRIAERPLDGVAPTLHTLDGDVKVTSKDVIVYTSSREAYPVRKSVYFGSYEVLGEVGSLLIGRRLVQERRGFPITSSAADLNLGDDRGSVSVQRGGWAYKSDDDDLGLINESMARATHVAIGSEQALRSRDWQVAFDRATWCLAAISPVATVTALCAFFLTLSGRPGLATILLAVEACLVIGGIVVAAWIKLNHWPLRAALGIARAMACQFQDAVAMLGQKTSTTFPSAALWRAAQFHEDAPASIDRQKMQRLKQGIADIAESSRVALNRQRVWERVATQFAWGSAVVAVILIVAAALTHIALLEIVAITLPSLAGALHSSLWRRQLQARISATESFLALIGIVRERLIATTVQSSSDDTQSPAAPQVVDALRMLCRVVAEYCQAMTVLAFAQEPTPPG